MALHEAVPVRTRTATSGAPTPAPPPAGGRVRAGVLTPSMGMGGAEQWIGALVNSTDSERIDWRGVVCSGLADIANDPGMVADVERVCPVIFGIDKLAGVAADCDVMLSWGLPWVTQYFTEPRPRLITVAHGSGPSTAFALQGNEATEALTAIANSAILPYMHRERVDVLPNAADERRLVVTRSREDVRAEWGLKHWQKAILFIGRFSPEKNPYALADAIACLPADWVGVAVGEGWKGDEVRAYLKRVGGERIVLAGMRQDVGNVYNAVDWMVMASMEEGCSLAMLEAWAMRVPIVATPVGFLQGRPDLARLVPTRATGEQLAAAFQKDERKAAKRQRRVLEAEQLVRTELNLQAFGQRWTDYIVKVANGYTS